MRPQIYDIPGLLLKVGSNPFINYLNKLKILPCQTFEGW